MAAAAVLAGHAQLLLPRSWLAPVLLFLAICCSASGCLSEAPVHLLLVSHTPDSRLMQVPITLYFMTHAYFCLYHALSNLLIRRAHAAVARYGSTAQVRAVCAVGAGLRLLASLLQPGQVGHASKSA